MDQKWPMISVSYVRIPTQTLYWARISVDLVEMQEELVIEKVLETETWDEIPMEDLIEHLHKTLQKYPNAKVTMCQQPTRPAASRIRPKGYELDQNFTNILRTDLAEAKKLFAPIERTIRIRPVAPKISTGEGE